MSTATLYLSPPSRVTDAIKVIPDIGVIKAVAGKY